jgi:hypothetical protein
MQQPSRRSPLVMHTPWLGVAYRSCAPTAAYNNSDAQPMTWCCVEYCASIILCSEPPVPTHLKEGLEGFICLAQKSLVTIPDANWTATRGV